MNRWNELIFCMRVQIQDSWKLSQWFLVGVARNRCDHLVHESLKSALSKEWVYELSWFFECRLWCNNFWLDWYPTLWFLNAEGPLQLYFLFQPIMICFRQSLRHTLLAQLVSKLFVFFSRGRKYETSTMSNSLRII